MKIVSWNINGYRAVTGQNPSKRYDVVTNNNKLFSYIESEKPDILCMQEIKADLDQIEPSLRCPDGYYSYFNSATSKKGYSGVAVFSKTQPISVNTSFNNPKFDVEGRLLELDFGHFKILNIYFPKGYADNDRLDYKMDFYDFLFSYIEKDIKSGKSVIISGDYNTAHKEIDLARPKENVGTSGFMPIEREKLDQMESMGFSDSFRLVNKNPGIYSWWAQRGRARENNIGWRIDYHWITNNLTDKIVDCYYQPDNTGSDHCPVVLEINL